MNRRDYLWGSLGAGAAALCAAGCGRVGQRFAPARIRGRGAGTNQPPSTPQARLLNRAGFGAAPGDAERLGAMAREAWVAEQLSAPVAAGVPSLAGLGLHALLGGAAGDDAGGETPGLLYRLAGIEPLHFGTYEERDFPEAKVREALTQAALLRAVYSKWQLRERMAAFWSDHFNIYGRKVVDFGKAYATTHLSYYLQADQMNVVRRHALGRFPDLLQASAHSPAMLGYLDNQLSHAGVANENYAREIMELHTLGVGGGYTQRDVQEVARCLTGWTIEDRFAHRRGTFRFDPARHDNGEKRVLGQTIPAGGGEADGVRVLTILSSHPATARFIAGKLVRHFHGSDDPARTNRLAAIYTATGGDIAAMLRPLLVSDDLPDAPPILKRPWDFLASALRHADADTDAGAGVQKHLLAMGQPLFEWPMPNGYPEKTTAWTGSFLARWNFACALAGGNIDRTAVAAAKGSASDAVALALCAPEFQWR